MVEHGRALAGVVVAKAGDDAAELGGAGHVGMAEHVAAAVHAGALAVPEAEDPLDAALAAEAACWVPQSAVAARSSFRPGSKLHVGGSELPVRLHHQLVDAAERRAAIAGGVAGGREAGRLVARLLHQQHAHQRLDAAEQDGALGEVEAVRERDVVQGHDTSRNMGPRSIGQEAMTNASKIPVMLSRSGQRKKMSREGPPARIGGQFQPDRPKLMVLRPRVPT